MPPISTVKIRMAWARAGVCVNTHNRNQRSPTGVLTEEKRRNRLAIVADRDIVRG